MWYIRGAVVLLVLGLFSYVYYRGVNNARSECKAAAIQSELDLTRRDLEIAKRQADLAESVQQRLATQVQKGQEAEDALRTELDKKADTCRADANGIKRLRIPAR